MSNATNLATATTSTAVDKPRRINPLGVAFEKLRAHLPTDPSREYRMSLDHERSLITAVTKATTEAFAAGTPTDVKSLLSGPRGDWIRKCQQHLYVEAGAKGMTRIFLPLFNAEKSPMKPIIEQLVKSCHETVPGGKQLTLQTVYIGHDAAPTTK